MDRRTFLAASLGGSVIGLSRFAQGDGRPGGAVPEAEGAARLPVAAIRDAWRHELFDDVLPFLDRRVIDHQHGGFLCTLSADGTHPDETKDTSFQGRGIWVYSFLYRHFGANPEHLAIARQAVELALGSMPSGEDRLWAARLTRDGRPFGDPARTIAADVAIAEGLAEFSRASGERQYRDLARRILLRCRRIYDRPDYAPGIVSVYGGPDPIPFPGARGQGAAMILIGTISPMLEGDPDPELEAILRGQIDAVIGRHHNPAFDLNNELLNHDYTRPANALAQFVYTGHCIETLGVVLRHAARVGDHALFDTAAARFRRHADVAWDDVYGGFYRSLDNVDENRWQLNKSLWVQEEALTAMLTIVEHTGAAWAADSFARTLEHVNGRYYLDRWGSRFWVSGGDRRVVAAPNLTRVEHYHHPRRLMLGILALDRLAARGGRRLDRPGSEI